jgi:hypothetical protein
MHLSRWHKAMSWLRWLVAGPSQQRPGSVHVGFVVVKVELWQVSFRVPRASPPPPDQYLSTVAFHACISPGGWWPHLRDIVSPYWHEKQQGGILRRVYIKGKPNKCSLKMFQLHETKGGYVCKVESIMLHTPQSWYIIHHWVWLIDCVSQ